MLIQWCLKGIPRVPGTFDDAQVQAILGGDAITSAWLRGSSQHLPDLPAAQQSALSDTALDQHVHAHHLVWNQTPYVSLSAGCVERIARGVTIRHSALRTALAFATQDATCEGYVFLCWVHVTPKPAPGLPGLAEEIRDLNLYSPYSVFHEEGEVVAKLFVPARQIRSATRFSQDLVRGQRFDNYDYVPPERVSNILGLV